MDDWLYGRADRSGVKPSVAIDTPHKEKAPPHGS